MDALGDRAGATYRVPHMYVIFKDFRQLLAANQLRYLFFTLCMQWHQYHIAMHNIKRL